MSHIGQAFGQVGKGFESMFKWFFIFAIVTGLTVLGGVSYVIYLLLKHFGVI